jgi:hypothetical protein
MLADTSAWIEWLRGTGSTPVLLLAAVFAPGDIVAFAGVVAQEVLQGARDDHAAAVYRRCRAAGRAVHGTVNCLIAALALEHDLPVLAWIATSPRSARCVASGS